LHESKEKEKDFCCSYYYLKVTRRQLHKDAAEYQRRLVVGHLLLISPKYSPNYGIQKLEDLLLLLLGLSLVRVLGRNMIIKGLLRRRLIITMPTLVLEGSTMLRLNMHMDCTLILLSKGTMGALKLSIGRAQILEGHFGELLNWAHRPSIFYTYHQS
jgi:hypothetical protein